MRQEVRFKTEMASRKVYHQSHVGEVLSLIYSPFYIDKQVIDAVLNRPVSGPLPDSFMNTLPESGPPDWQMQFLSALCPSCGWDLSGERNAIVLTCANCNSAWQPVGSSLKPVPVGFFPDDKADLFLPFWRIKADVSGIPLSSYADLVHLANLPRVMQKGWDQVEFRFWSLAFKLSPKEFLSLSIRMNLTQPREELKSGNPPGSIYPTTLSVAEAWSDKSTGDPRISFLGLRQVHANGKRQKCFWTQLERQGPETKLHLVPSLLHHPGQIGQMNQICIGRQGNAGNIGFDSPERQIKIRLVIREKADGNLFEAAADRLPGRIAVEACEYKGITLPGQIPSAGRAQGGEKLHLPVRRVGLRQCVHKKIRQRT